MGTAEGARGILEERARLLAIPLSDVVPDAGVHHFITFTVGEALYGVEEDAVRGVAPLGQVASVPGAPPGIAGVTTHLGDLLTVADFRVLLGLTPCAPGTCGFVLVLADGPGQLGLMVEGFGDMATVGADEMRGAPTEPEGAEVNLILGVAPGGLLVVNVPGLLARSSLGGLPVERKV